MGADLKLLLIGWVLLTSVVIALAVYRKRIAGKEDHFLHVNDMNVVAQQTVVGQKLQAIDRWGKGLTVVAAAYGLAIAAMYLYAVWQNTATVGFTN
jgi:hypothetical protein